MKKKKIIKIVVIVLLFIVVLLVGVVLLVNKDSNSVNKNSNSANKNPDVEKLIEYSETLTEFNCQDAISSKGYISEDDAFKIIATSTVIRNDDQIQMKEYLKRVDSIGIEFVENNESNMNNSSSGFGSGIKSEGTYWKIILVRNSSSYMEKAQFNVDYYTGEILFGKVIQQININ